MALLLLPSGRASFQGQSHPLQPADLLMLVALFTGFLGQLVRPSISAVWKQTLPPKLCALLLLVLVLWLLGAVLSKPHISD